MNKLEAKRKIILKRMGQIRTMCRGSLSEEYRESQVAEKKTTLGPYIKHQEWRNGRNNSRRIKKNEAEVVREGIAGLNEFKALAEDFIDTTLALTDRSRQKEAAADDSADIQDTQTKRLIKKKPSSRPARARRRAKRI